MRRREFIALVGGGAIACSSFSVRAQQTTVPVVGFLHGGLADGFGKAEAQDFGAALQKPATSKVAML